MIASRAYRILLIVFTGGMLFQTTGSCKNQAIDMLMSDVLPSVATALVNGVLSSLVSGAAG